MQARKRAPVRRNVSRRTNRSHAVKGDHSVVELYLHGLAAITGLGILIIPVIIAAVYGAFSVYLTIAAGFVALMIGILLYDISITHERDPYRFLKDTSGKEYSFIFGFLLTIAFIIIIVAAGIASVEELSAYFGMNIYNSIGVVDIALIVIWGILLYRHERPVMNITGGIKLGFLALLIIVGALAAYTYGFNPMSSVQTNPSSAYSFIPMATAIVLFFWMYGGFESVSLVYKGEDTSRVARTLVYVMFSAIILFAVVQLLVYLLGGNVLGQTLSVSSIFTPNVLSGGFGGLGQSVIVGIAIFVILTVALSVANAANHTLDKMAEDKIMPRFLLGNVNTKSLITLVIPIVLITIFSYPITSSSFNQFEYLSIVILSAMVFVTAFIFFSVGYAIHYAKNKSHIRLLFGIVVALLLLALLVSMPWPFLLGLIIILFVALLGYALLK